MDITRYDKEIRELYEDYNAYIRKMDAHAIGVMKRLLARARAMEDDALTGYCCHSLAFTSYFILEDYDAFLKYLRRAVRVLVRAGDEAELMHVFYLIAIDTINRGMYDIAYNYFMTARTCAERTHQEASVAVLDENIAHVLMQLDAFEESRAFTARSLKRLKKHREHPHYYSNVPAGYMNDGIALLEMGRYAEAKERYDETHAFAKAHEAYVPARTLFDLAIFGARLFLEMKEMRGVRRELSRLKELSAEISQIADYIESLAKLGDALIRKGHPEEAARIIALIEEKTIASDATRAQQLLADLRVDYHTATGDRKKLAAACSRQDEIYARLRAEQKNAYRYTSDLITLIGELRAEQARVQEEHDKLLAQTLTDELTSLPNRHAMDLHLEEAFDRAQKKTSLLGVAIIDVDDLKIFNDTYGHLAGDRLLRQTGRLLSEVMEEGRVFSSRYGGDEFVMIFENMETAAIRRVLGSVARKSDISLSYGVCNRVPDAKSRSWDYFTRADQALYRSKRRKQGGG